MTLPFSVEIVPVVWVFWAWAALSIGYFLHGASARRGEISRQRFGARGWMHMLFANGIGGMLLYFANAGLLWAAAFFAVAGLWLIYDRIATPIALKDIGPGPSRRSRCSVSMARSTRHGSCRPPPKITKPSSPGPDGHKAVILAA